MKSSNPHSGCRQVEVSKCLDTTNPDPSKNQGGVAIVEAVPYTLKIRSGVAVDSSGKAAGKGALIQTDKAATLAATQDQYLFQPILDDQGGSQISVRTDGKSPTLRAEMHGNVPCVLSIENHPADSRVNIDESGKVQTLTSRMGTGGGNVPMVMEPQPVYCLQGNGIDRADTAGCNGKGWKEDTCYTLNTIDRPAVAYLASGKDSVGTLMANAGTKLWLGNQEAFSGDYHIIEETEPPAVRYIVRRLTPTECARLQGFPDDWGHPDIKESLSDDEYAFWLNVRNTHAEINGKATKEYTKEQMLKWYNSLHTDSAEYKMWGNGIALPCALYIMEGIAEVLAE
jgi:DNA (cytosine-5)-methyltransferase 1